MNGGEPIQPGPGQTAMFGDAASVAVAGRVGRCETALHRGAVHEADRVWLDGRSYVTAASLLAALTGGE